jgi:hypothetical protein
MAITLGCRLTTLVRGRKYGPGDHGTLEVPQWFAELHELPTML